MLKNKILEKLLAIILIFTLTSVNFAFVTKSYASTIAEAIFGSKSDTGHENIGFDAYFETEDESTSVISDVNNEELAISMNLKVKENGYLKDAKIAIAEAEEGKGLNFKLKEKDEYENYVQEVEDNVFMLQQINSSSDDVKISVPIEYKNETYVSDENLSKDCLVIFSGIYVDNDGEEIEVSKEVKLNVSWKDERKVKLETNVTKYIDFGEGIILQTIVKLDSSSEKNTLPVKESQITIDVPTLNDVVPSNVYVVANNTTGTNGEKVGEVNFNQDNWNFDSENNKLSIKVNNEKKLVQVNEFEDEYLQDSEKEVIEEERYYNGSGIDEYLITYTYQNVEISDENISVNSNIDVKISTLSGIEDEENIKVISNNEKYEYALEGKIGDIVSLNIENETTDVSKVYTYLNYNNSNKYETEFVSKTVVNVSYTEIIKNIIVEDIENKYIDKESNTYENNDIYYEQISLAKENFMNILGENGEVKVFDLNKNLITTINNETEVNEDGNIVVTFGEKYSRLSFEISKPIGEGNLVINNIKAMSNSSQDKSTFANISNIVTKTALKVDYTYVENTLEIENVEVSINLVNTETKANLVMDRDSLSTLEENNDVEIRIELNNAVETSDVYGHSVFELELPDTIEKFEITNASLLYAEGLKISSVDVVDRKVVVTIDGKQDGINSGVLTNGTNIVLNANIKVNLFTPAKSEIIKLKYNNDEATNYVEDGVSELTINYSAPTGLVTVNSISNYNETGAVVTSVRQGEKEDLIDIYSNAKTATMEIIVMNNNSNSVSNISILGRIPFKDVKDIETGENLGTTADTKLVNVLIADERNNSEFVIYYSENGEATKDIEDSSNNWVTNPESFENIKSYLIVPVDENYKMNESEILRFTYQYEIPENLPHNEEFYGTFYTYYTNNSEIAVTDEVSKPDLVGLTTGEGPELNLEVSTDQNTIKEYEELQVRLNAKNIGKSKAEEINIEYPIPEFTTYISSECENAEVKLENNVLKIFANELEVDKNIEVIVSLRVNSTSNYDIKENQEFIIKSVANVTAKDLGTIINSKAQDVKITQSEFRINESNRSDIDEVLNVQKVGNEVTFNINVSNLTNKEMNNVVITKELPKEFSFKSTSIIGYEKNGITPRDMEGGSFDENTRVVTWNIEKLQAKKSVQVKLVVTVNPLEGDITVAKVETVSNVKADGTDTYQSNVVVTTVGKPSLVVTQTTETADTYIKEGDRINYLFTIKNEGKATAEYVKFKDVIPDGIIIEKINYIIDGIPAKKKITSNEEAALTVNLAAGKELTVNIQAVAKNLNGVQEKTITNYSTVSAVNVEEITSNSITHIVETSPKNIITDDFGSSASSVSTSTKTNITKTYKISGTAWLDSNSDGMRTTDEELLSGISVKLVNSETGVIQKTITTDSNGTYTFSGIENGNYLVIFDYDTVKYTVTAYQKDGVGANVNSDAVTTKLEQNGKTRNGAITDVISVENGSISGIDIGLVLADKFDLKLDKSISKVITQSSNGTVTDTYDNVDFAKTEIASKHLSGSTVYVEYTMTVSNVGDVSGYAKKIIDYLPEGMTFNSSLESNASWYTGSDGNLYTTALSEKELAPGETASVKLILTKKMTEENTGVVNNLAEIYEDYNKYGISDTNSTPGNKAQGENDLGSANIVISVKTGEVFIYVSVIITSILLGSIVIFIAFNKIVLAKRKGGV